MLCAGGWNGQVSRRLLSFQGGEGLSLQSPQAPVVAGQAKGGDAAQGESGGLGDGGRLASASPGVLGGEDSHVRDGRGAVGQRQITAAQQAELDDPHLSA